jgi:predicted aldo/keto reductase-like oxidoreductase
MKRREFLKLTSLLLGGFLSQGFSLNKIGQPEFINDSLSKVTRARFKDITLPLLTLGCMRLPLDSKNQYGIDEVLFQKMVDYSIERGVNFFDTAYFYMDGKSEIVLGRALKKHSRKSFYISDKLPVVMVNSESDVERLFNEQLQKTGLDYFDFYFAHNLNAENYKNNFKKYNVYKFLQKKKEQGKIKYLGFSFHDNPETLELITKEFKWDFAMIQLNYMDWDLMNADQLYNTLQKRNIPVWVMEPVRGGQLVTLNKKAVKVFKDANPNVSTASWGMRYAASLPGVITVLSGMSNMEQLQDNIKTMTDFKPLSNNERTIINNALTAYRSSGAVPCTNCKYCVPYCPLKIDIPNNIGLYNQYLANKNEPKTTAIWRFTAEYNALNAFERAEKCVNCKACIPHCPQKIDIPNVLTKVKDTYVGLTKKS